MERYNVHDEYMTPSEHGNVVLHADHDAALRRAKEEGLDEALKLCAIIENHYATKGVDERVAKIQQHAVAGVRQSIIDHLAKLDARAAQIERGEL